MSSKDNPLKGRSNEEEYFNRQNREAIEKMKTGEKKDCGGKCGGNCKCPPEKKAARAAAAAAKDAASAPAKDAAAPCQGADGKGCGCK